MQQTLTRPAPAYRSYDQYLTASPAAQETVDAVRAALAKFTAPTYDIDTTAGTGEVGVSFRWHDGAGYHLTLTRGGELLRLFRIQYTGRMVEDGAGTMVEEAVWRTVRAFSKDRAGKILGRTLEGRPAAGAWTEAASK